MCLSYRISDTLDDTAEAVQTHHHQYKVWIVRTATPPMWRASNARAVRWFMRFTRPRPPKSRSSRAREVWSAGFSPLKT